MGTKAIYQELPMDLVYDVLTVLPVKTLRRFQWVSKQWCSIISHPSFQEDHYNRQTTRDPHRLITRYSYKGYHRGSINGILQLFTYGNDGTLINNVSIEFPEEIKPIQSCQGLVCLADSEEGYILVCNPSTMEIIGLPPPPTSRDCCNTGFGFATSTKEFKVVNFFDFGEIEDKLWCEVFTLGTSGWREVMCPPLFKGYYCPGAPFLNGALHLLPILSRPNFVYFIQAFDIEREEFTTIPFPEVYSISGCNAVLDKKLLVFGGFLWLTVGFQINMALWHLKDYNSREWVKDYVIDLLSFGPNVWGETLAIMPDGVILLSIYFANAPKKQYCYNPREKSFILNTVEDYKTTLFVESFWSLTFLGNHRE